MEYLAHVEGERTQTILEHLKGTAQLASQFADEFGKKDWGYCCGILHDIGKYSEQFQERIRGERRQLVDHSTAGAQLCFEKGGLYPLMSYCIAGHHRGLPDCGGKLDEVTAPTLMARRRKKVEDYQAYREEIEIPDLCTNPFDPEKVKNFDFSLSVFIRMLYSCLVDADFLDTERFMKDGKVERDGGEQLESLFAKLLDYVGGWLDECDLDTVNGRRTEILRYCLEAGELKKGLFRLTVPTGGGKTISSLAFALRHGAEHRMKRIIYVIPYTSIIEQTAKIFREIFGEENVLENHCNVDYRDGEELSSMQLASENWDKPIVVTTNVQFFESLFANKSSKCRKLHNIVNSVVIFDEAQMLPGDYLRPCIAMIEELLINYGTSVVLCTATQPALDAFFQSDIQAQELCPRVEEQFRYFERVTFENIGMIREDDLVERLNREEQSLCIVNTKKRAQGVYRRLQGEGTFHLSTAMYPNHRRRILEKVKRRLRNGERCILVSTSLVEAGVDLDFHTVYRQLSGVDSMIQAAGRCNREGKRTAKESKVSIFRFEEKEYAPGQRQQIDIAKSLLADQKDITALENIKKYFQMLYRLRGEELDKKGILDEFKRQKYNFEKVGKEFKLIEEDTKMIFVSQEEEAENLLQEMKNQGYTKMRMREAGQYCVQVYETELEKLRGAGLVNLICADMPNFYELTDKGKYTDEMGLDLGLETGIAVMM